MKDKNDLKKIIVILVTIILIIILIYFWRLNKTTSKNINVVSNIEDINEAYNVKICASKFYEFEKNYITNRTNYVYSLIDRDYIEYYSLDENGLREKIGIINSDELQFDEVYKVSQKNDIAIYYIKGTQLYKNDSKTSNFEILLKIDNKNNIFSVYLNDYISDKGYNNIKLGNKFNINLKEVKENRYNKFDSSSKHMIDNVEDIFSQYNNNCIFYPNRSYELLDNACKSEKYVKFEDFKEYLKANMKDIVLMDLKSYEDSTEGGYIIYKCKSTKGNTYIFKVKSYITYSVAIE